MDKDRHHLISIGMLAKCYHQVDADTQNAIEEGLRIAIDLDMGFPPDAVDNMRQNKPLMGPGSKDH